MIGDRKSLLLGQPFFQASYDLSGAPQSKSNLVSEDFSLRHASLEHKENECASRYILYNWASKALAAFRRQPAQRRELPALSQRPASSNASPSEEGICGPFHWCEPRITRIGGRVLSILQLWVTLSTSNYDCFLPNCLITRMV